MLPKCKTIVMAHCGCSMRISTDFFLSKLPEIDSGVLLTTTVQPESKRPFAISQDHFIIS